MEKVIHIIPTPIGNLEDITLRAIRILREVDVVLAEDTRVTKKLFKRYDIATPLSSYHIHNEHTKTRKIIEEVKNGKMFALVSDAGTPVISDPGFLLVRECIKSGIDVKCLPGATACIPAIIQSGITCNRFMFEGFLPIKKGRKKRIESIISSGVSTIIYESPHRILKTLKELSLICPNKKIVVLKELTKLYENIYTGSIFEIIDIIAKSTIKGEFIIILSGE